MAKRYIVDLKADEQEMLAGLIACGTQRVRKINHARILLRERFISQVTTILSRRRMLAR